MSNTSDLVGEEKNPFNLLHGLMAEPVELTWYVARTATRQERRAEEGLTQAAVPFYLPRLTRWWRVGGRKRKVTQSLFEGYFFVGLADGRSMYGISDIAGVCGLVRFGYETPRPVDFGPIALTVAAERNGLFDKTGVAVKVFSPGEAIVITGGKFAGYTAEFVHMAAQDRVSVLVDMFGRKTPLKLKLGQIESRC